MTQSGPPVPLTEGGLARFEALADELPRLLDRLRRASVWSSERDGPLPAVPGVYLLSEEHPIYVGQTRNLRRRLRQHGGMSSRENQASLAFNIARREAADHHPSFNIHLTRRALEADPAFAQLFGEARARVARMQVRYVEIDDPELRTVFEVYAAVAFGTAEHNSFETH
jgi:GIY-YIG catalytic domain-containing protein